MTAGAGGAARLRHRRRRGGPAAARAGRRPDAPGSARRWSWSASPCAGPAATAATCRSTRRCSPPTRSAWSSATTSTWSVEVVGGIEPARTWLVEALRAGKSVVTANKALLAEDGAALHDAAAEGGADLYYEASVAGAIPLLRPLRESLHGDRITRVTGIVNGTTNFILSAMDATGAGFAEALDEATALGLRRGRPDRRRRGLRRRRQGRDPRLAGLPHPGHRRRRATARASPRSPPPTWPAPRRWAAPSSCSASRRAPTDGACQRPGAPGDDPAQRTRWPASATRSTRSSSRPRRPGSSCSTAAAPAARRPPARCSATSSRWPATGSPGSARASESTYADLPIRPMGEVRHPLPRLPRRGRPGRRARRRRRRLRPARRVHRDRPPGGPRRRRHAGHRHPRARTDAALARTVDGAAARLGRSVRVDGDVRA